MFAQTQVAFLAVAAVIARAQILPPNCARTYTVQPGDFCDKISAEQNVSTFQLADVNKNIIDPACDNLFPGETLCLGITGQDCMIVHVVQEGDLCTSIAAGAGIDISTLLANNPNVDANCDNIGIGEVLCTAPTVIVGGGNTTTTTSTATTATPVSTISATSSITITTSISSVNASISTDPSVSAITSIVIGTPEITTPIVISSVGTPEVTTAVISSIVTPEATTSVATSISA